MLFKSTISVLIFSLVVLSVTESEALKSPTIIVELSSFPFNFLCIGVLLFWMHAAAAVAKLFQSCQTLCNPIDGSPPGSPIPGILQAKNTGVGCHFLLQCMKMKSESEVTQSCPILCDPMDCSLPGSSVHGFSRQQYWNGLPFPTSGECS